MSFEKVNSLKDNLSLWRSIELGEVAEVLSGYAFKRTDFTSEGVPVVKIKNIIPPNVELNDIEFISSELAKQKQKYILEFNDILISMTGSNVNQMSSVVGKVGRVKIHRELILNQRVGKVFVKNSEKYDEDFLYYYISRDEVKYQLATMAGGSANQANISPKQIKQIFIPFPPLIEQKKISSILSSLDEKIELNNAINKNLEAMAQALFKRWFIDFEFPNENGEPYKLSGGEFEESELGLIPKGWQVEKIGNCTQLVVRGIAPKYDEESDQKVINQKCIRNGLLNKSLARTHRNKVSEEKQLKFGDVLVNSTGTGTLGRVAQVYEEIENYTVDSHVTIIRPNLLNGLGYIGCLLKRMQPNFEHAATGSTGQTELGRETIKQMNILLPKEQLIKQFSEIYDSLYKFIIINQKNNESLAQLRDTLLPKLMSGELRVPLEKDAEVTL